MQKPVFLCCCKVKSMHGEKKRGFPGMALKTKKIKIRDLSHIMTEASHLSYKYDENSYKT